jgi:UDP-N-acetylmuramoylalanine--D-glutamate ligase
MTTLANPYSDRSIVVLGLGRSGIAAARFLLRKGARVTVCDSGESSSLLERAELLRSEGATVLTGTAGERDPLRYDLAILSPGIEETTPLVTNVTAKGTPLIGELELAFGCCSFPVVAITGSNGKTTTTELTSLMLTAAGWRNAVCGNIGTPMSELLLAEEAWDLLVIEVSSFQLETIKTFRPKVAMWLNLSPNHLDRYPSMLEYRAAKLRIFENQTAEDFAVIPEGALGGDIPPLKARTVTFSTTGSSADLTLRGSEILHREEVVLDLARTKLRGPHNAANLMAAFGCGIALGADLKRMAEAVVEYIPPAHRCELIAESNGVRWINDSKATNLDAMEKAIQSVQGPLILIAGGKDKGFEFAPIAPLVRDRVSFAILLGEMRHRIARDWAAVPLATVGSLEEAVAIAATKARAGSTVLFSPGTSSYDMFNNYIERGETFRNCVKELSKEPILTPAS